MGVYVYQATMVSNAKSSILAGMILVLKQRIALSYQTPWNTNAFVH